MVDLNFQVQWNENKSKEGRGEQIHKTKPTISEPETDSFKCDPAVHKQVRSHQRDKSHTRQAGRPQIGYITLVSESIPEVVTDSLAEPGSQRNTEYT
jgi:hypothetical protein